MVSQEIYSQQEGSNTTAELTCYKYIALFLVERRWCTHPVSGLPDITPHARESDPFKYRVRT